MRAVCSCGWNGPEQRLDWEVIGKQELQDRELLRRMPACRTGMRTPPRWSGRLFTALVAQLEAEIETLAKSSPLAAVRAARRL
ncbi:hypothetical protein [Streptomyces rhizosphaerihabitans]|uniref:hypothetical protein n=1 Tax=Streptomyces rhizosphaerihabitans TaxID=1266770 RepID=UPI0021C12104|nr:hypothetical protein [Streptomyces rhizosphaerihabitans]MCT9010540.1 hypothetical protein [Streptomyces rhizosphaerihabitans]